MLQRERQVGDDIASLVAAVVTHRVDLHRVERLLADELRHGIGQLSHHAR